MTCTNKNYFHVQQTNKDKTETRSIYTKHLLHAEAFQLCVIIKRYLVVSSRKYPSMQTSKNAVVENQILSLRSYEQE